LDKIFRVKTFKFILLTIIYRILVDYFHINYMVINWNYMGFYLNINGTKIFLSYLFLIIFLYFIPLYKKEKLSHFLVILLFYTMYIPIGSIYGLQDKSNMFFIIANLSFFILVFFTIIIDRKSKTSLIVGGEFHSKIMPLLYGISIYVFLIMTIQNVKNINLENVLNLRAVYEVRRGATYNWGMNYFFSWQTKVINPYMIAINYMNKNKKDMLIYLAFQIWLYILTGHKLVLFIVFVAFIIIKFSSKLKDLPDLLSKGFVGLFVLSKLELLMQPKSIILDFFLRRVLYIPALIGNYYYDFFSQYGFQYWKYSLLGRVFNLTTDFPVQPPYIIGEVYFGNPRNFAVTGYLGTEYMNGGILGVLLASIFLIFIFKYMDMCSERIGREIVLITIIAPIYTLWNTGILTAFLTGGVFLSLLILGQTKIDKSKYRDKLEI